MIGTIDGYNRLWACLRPFLSIILSGAACAEKKTAVGRRRGLDRPGGEHGRQAVLFGFMLFP